MEFDSTRSGYVDELQGAFESQPKRTIICDFNEAVRSNGLAGQVEFKELLKKSRMDKYHWANRRGLLQLPFGRSAPSLAGFGRGVGAVGVGLIQDVAMTYAMDDLIATPSFFQALRSYEESDRIRQDYYIGMYLNGGSNGLEPRIIADRARGFIHSQMECARMQGRLTYKQETDYYFARDIDNIIPLWVELRGSE